MERAELSIGPYILGIYFGSVVIIKLLVSKKIKIQ